MSILSSLGLMPSPSLYPSGSKQVSFGSPWTESSLETQVFANATGLEVGAIVTRDVAMKVPAVVKARALIVGTLAHQPLAVYDEDVRVDTLPAWVQGTNTELPPWHRMAWTLDDLMFTGWSLWLKQYAGTELIATQRCPRNRWRLTGEGTVQLTDDGDNWVDALARDVILIPGPQEGLLDIAADTIRAARAIELTIADRAVTPSAEIEIKNTNGDVLTPDEIDDLVEDYIDSRRKIGSQTVGYTPTGYDVIHHGNEQNNMLIEARNAIRLDIAAYFNLPAALLDASLSTASLTYSTQEGKRNELIDYSLSFWADPIAARLSQDDIVDLGLRTRFDMTEFTALVNNPTSPVTED